MYSKTYSYYVNPAKRLFCSDAQGTPIATLPNLYFGERPVFTMTFGDDVLVEGEKLVFVMDNENRFLDSHSTTGLAPVMAWCVHEITAEDVQSKSIDLELYCFGKKYADVINGHDNAVTCILSLFIKSIDENLNCTFSTLATTLSYAEPTIVSPDCVFDELPIDMYLTRDEMNALIAEVEALQREAIEKAEQAQQSAQEAKEAADSVKDLKPLILTEPPTTSTVGVAGKLGLYRDSTNKDHLYHLVFISTSANATLYHWEECVLESQRNVANGFAGLDGSGKVLPTKLPTSNQDNLGAVKIFRDYGIGILDNGRLFLLAATETLINQKNNNYNPIVPKNVAYAVRSVLPLVTEIPAATSDYSLVDSSATTLNHSHTFVHTPASVAPTYRLPAVSDTTVSHYIELTVDFANVQTYSFLDYQGEPSVPLFTPSIAAGDVYTFKMEYSAIKAAWLIYPQKQGAVADDFVMRGEVGAANGVAGLDGNAKVKNEQLSLGTDEIAGIVRAHPNGNYGVKIGISGDAIGRIEVIKASNENIFNRTHQYKAIVPANLNYAVTAAITDANHITLNDAQKATAQGVFGVGGPITEIPAATSEYTLSEGIFKHAPTNAPTYNLPSITDTIRSHVIVIAIDFSSVQTFSFLVDGGGDVTFQSYANPTTGDVWVFRCWWYGGKWRICPMKIKNCVTRQLASGSLAITDAVAGDALSLKMTAPRSVVVNQLFNKDTVTGGINYLGNAAVGLTAANGVFTYTVGGQLYGLYFNGNTLNVAANHKLLFKAKVNYAAVSGLTNRQVQVGFIKQGDSSVKVSQNYVLDAFDVDTVLSGVLTVTTSADNYLLRIQPAGSAEHNDDLTFTVSNVQLVDLTQYFNGDATLINSIQTWDDLVAYDPRFAQYVEYNTGTVEGVQPTVKVTGKNLFNKNALANYSYTAETETNSGRTCLRISGGLNPSNASANSLKVVFPFPMFVTPSFWAKKTATQSQLKINYIYEDGTSWNLNIPITDTWTYFSLVSHDPLKKVKTLIFNNGGNGTGVYSSLIDVDTIQIELGSVATAYEPYHDGGTAQAPAPLFAVYSAADEYEAVSGTTTGKMGVVDLGTLNWIYRDNRFLAIIPEDLKLPEATRIVPSIITAHYIPYKSDVSLDTAKDGIEIAYGNNFITYAESSSSPTPTGRCYYELATPTTSQSTPTQISLQAGNNVAMQTDGERLAPIDITYESDEL